MPFDMPGGHALLVQDGRKKGKKKERKERRERFVFIQGKVGEALC